MPATKKPVFEIVVGLSTKGPDFAAKDAEKKAKKAGGEQVSIAASVLGGGQSSPLQDEMLVNIAKNIYQLVQCECPTTVGEKITKPGTPPPFLPSISKGAANGPLWVVYILLRRQP
jgi:hypothetical protein